MVGTGFLLVKVVVDVKVVHSANCMLIFYISRIGWRVFDVSFP